MLSDTDINSLEEILFDDAWAEDALDFFGLHGLICASVVGPVELNMREIFALATGLELADVHADTVPETFSRLMEQLARQIRQELELENVLELPEPEDGDPMNALENWCAGFVDAFMLNEDAWLDVHESEVADLMLPVMALSGLFEDEDFVRVRNNPELANQMAEQIPETLTDLYLLFHAPD